LFGSAGDDNVHGDKSDSADVGQCYDVRRNGDDNGARCGVTGGEDASTAAVHFADGTVQCGVRAGLIGSAKRRAKQVDFFSTVGILRRNRGAGAMPVRLCRMRKRWREQYESAAYDGYAKGNLHPNANADGEQHERKSFAVVTHNFDPHGKLEPARRKQFRATHSCRQT